MKHFLGGNQVGWSENVEKTSIKLVVLKLFACHMLSHKMGMIAGVHPIFRQTHD